MIQSQLTQMFEDAIYSSLLFVWDIFKPYIMPILGDTAIIIVFKKITGECVYQFSFISGDNHKTAKRKAKKAKEIVDLAASVNDIHDSLK